MTTSQLMMCCSLAGMTTQLLLLHQTLVMLWSKGAKMVTGRKEEGSSDSSNSVSGLQPGHGWRRANASASGMLPNTRASTQVVVADLHLLVSCDGCQCLVTRAESTWTSRQLA